MAPAPTPAHRDHPPAAIPLSRVDVGMLDIAPVLALLRLDRAVDPAAVRRAVDRHVPERLAAAVVAGPDGAPELRPDRPQIGFAVLDVEAGAIDRRLGPNVPLRELAAIGLGDAPARDPLCTATHLRAPEGDALAVRVSHAAGDGVGLIAMLGRIATELEEAGPGADAAGREQTGPRTDARPWHAPAPTTTAAAPSAGEDVGTFRPVAFSAGTDDRWLSVLPLSTACRAEIEAVVAAGTGASRTVCRMAVVARRLAPLVLPAGDELRIRIPIDLRFRDLGIPPDAVGNHWFDALAVLDGPHERLPSAAVIAGTIARTIRDRVAELSPGDVDHRDGESLRLTREVPGVPIRRGLDLVHSSLPTPAWPGVRALHVLGSATLGVVDQRGTDRVDVVTPRPLPAGVVEL